MTKGSSHHQRPISVVVVGGGIAGTATAMYLAESGAQVTCIEHHEQVATETSYMNGSLACASLTRPWCSLANLRGFAIQSLSPGSGKSKSVNVIWSEVALNWNFWKWILHFTRFAAHKEHYGYLFNSSYQLSKYSLGCMGELDQDFDADICHNGPAKGTIQLFPSADEQHQQLLNLSPVVKGLHKLSPEEVTQLDLVLSQTELFPGGGIFSDLDRSYNIHLLCQQLQRRAQKYGAKFIFGHKVTSLTLHKHSAGGDGMFVPYVELSDGRRIHTDTVVVAAGNHSNAFAEQAGDGSHSWPVRGFALEVPLNKSAVSTGSSSVPNAPLSLTHNVVDDPRRIYIAPLNHTTVRLSGFCELGSEIPDKSKTVDFSGAYDLLEQARALLPSGYLVPSSDPAIKVHTCWRPQTADDLPVLGRSATVGNLHYNSGHGHLGLTRAVGSAKLLSELIMQGKVTSASNIDMSDYRPDRFKVSSLFGKLRRMKR